MISGHCDSAVALKHFSGQNGSRFAVQTVRVALDPYYKDFQQDEFHCPILQEVMTDPYITPWGQSFERCAIEQWVQRKQTCPITRRRLNLHQLKPNQALRAAIAAFGATKKEGEEESAESWPASEEQHVKMVLVNFKDESHLHSFMHHHHH